MDNETGAIIANHEKTHAASLFMPGDGKPVVIGIGQMETFLVTLWSKTKIFFIALKCYRSVFKTLKALRGLEKFKISMWGSKKKRRCVRVDGKYYFGLYVPGFPSRIWDQYIQTELNRVLPHNRPVNRLEALYLAMTTKCPLRCEHCFEWDNLNQPEAFNSEELQSLIKSFQGAGCAQFHFTGGEPLVRMKRLVELVRTASVSSDCWVLTSGQNLSMENARRLKIAGATGVMISLDDYDPARHNAFRGRENAFEWAMKAAHHARQAKLVTAFSICLRREFISGSNLLRYAKLAKDCGVSFVQLLEPRAVGHFAGKDVLLTRKEIDLLDSLYLKLNFDEQFQEYPVFIYHGYHQRRIGCLAGGKWALYIDSAGYIHACPFCHTKDHHASDILSEKLKLDAMTIASCPAFA